MKVRAHFEKVGVMRYISHLDLQRAFLRALVRSGLDITYSEGFNPHPKLAFAIPLSMFQESVCEVCDFGVNGDMPLEEIAKALQNALPRAIKVTSVEVPTCKICDVVSASYEITLHTQKSVSDIENAMKSRLVATKKGKNGDTEADITDKVFSYSITESERGIKLLAKVSASQNAILNPALIASALGVDDFDIIRTAIEFEK